MNVPEIAFKRRQRRQDHYHHLDKTIIFAYPNLSDGAKLTYIVLDSYDWEDSEGKSKGCVFPYQSTLAKIRGISTRTIRRHLEELVNVGLLTVQTFITSTGKRNLYWIEECSPEEFERYLELMSKQDKNNSGGGEDKNVRRGEDKNVRYKDTNIKNKKDKDKTESQVESGPISDDEFKRVKNSFISLMNRQPSTTETKHLERLLAIYGIDDVENAFTELVIQKEKQSIQNPLRYLEGILTTWLSEGRRTTNVLEFLKQLNEEQSLPEASFSPIMNSNYQKV